MLFITANSWKKNSNHNFNKFTGLNKENKQFDKAWIISFITFILIHIFDITYFDGRISSLAWILLAGMRSIINENSILKKNV